MSDEQGDSAIEARFRTLEARLDQEAVWRKEEVDDLRKSVRRLSDAADEVEIRWWTVKYTGIAIFVVAALISLAAHGSQFVEYLSK